MTQKASLKECLAVLLAAVTPAVAQGMNAAAAKALARAAATGLSAAPGSLQDHTGDVHIHSHWLVTDDLQSGGEGEREISLSLSQSFSEIPEHCHWNAVLALEILGRDGIVICELMQAVG